MIQPVKEELIKRFGKENSYVTELGKVEDKAAELLMEEQKKNLLDFFLCVYYNGKFKTKKVISTGVRERAATLELDLIRSAIE